MTQKILIFDASTIISFTMNGLLDEFRELKKAFGGKFIIPVEVREEVIDKPLKIRRFELEALKVQQLLDDGILEMSSVLGIKDSEVSKRAKYLIELANGMFVSRGRDVRLIDSGETACVALVKILKEKGVDSVFAVDERTTRMLIETPENLKDLMERKMHTKVQLKNEHFKNFKGLKIVRSIELIYMAYKKGLVRLKGDLVLEALLYAMKFKGCSVSEKEIRELKRIG